MLKFIQHGENGEVDFEVKDLEFEANISLETFKKNIRASIARGGPWLKDTDPHNGTAIIAAGGPSLAQELEFLRICQSQGDAIFALNNVPAYLVRNGITPDCHVLLDSLDSVSDYVHPEIPMQRYYAVQCAPKVFSLAPATMWIPHIIGLETLFPELQPPFVGGGTTVGTRAIGLAYQLGYRKFRLIGLDSSYDGNAGHAYEQEDYREFLDVTCGGKVFKCPPQLMAQAEEFQNIIPELLNNGCEIGVYGNGLLRTLAEEILKQSIQ